MEMIAFHLTLFKVIHVFMDKKVGGRELYKRQYEVFNSCKETGGIPQIS